MRTIDEVVEDFENKFGLSGLVSNPLEYSNLKKDEYDNVKNFIRTALTEQRDSIINFAKSLYREEGQIEISDGTAEEYRKEGYNQALKEVRDYLDNV